LIARAWDCVASVSVARIGSGWQPLSAVYRREFADLAENALCQGRYKIDPLFDPSRTLTIAEEELAAAGFSVSMFRNLNTQEDLQVAQAGCAKGGTIRGRNAS
jgi:molybdopterin-guanine dinucleotide biosynthesis protein A